MDFVLPELGEGVYEAELVAWNVKPGDDVRRGQILAEVITDKATMELPAPFAGKIESFAAQPGDEIKVGQVILAYQPAGRQAESDAEASTMPEAAMSEGGAAEGVAPQRLAAETAENGRTGEHRSVAVLRAKTGAEHPGDLPPASPSVRHMARQLGIDLKHVLGSGPGGRILIEDLSRCVTGAVRPAGSDSADELRAAFGKAGTRIPLRGVRKTIAEHMVVSKRTAPHYSYVDECDLTEMVRLRNTLKEPFAAQGVKLTYLAFFVQAVARALVAVPIVNASLDDEAGEIILHAQRNIGVAVATPSGLIVPVVRNADQKSLAVIAREIEQLSAAVRAGRADREDLLGGTFTVTSIGNIGGLISTPIINYPQVGILGVGKIVRRPVFDTAGNIVPAEMGYLSFTFDHRVVDGAIGAAFGNEVMRWLKQPAAMLVDR